MSSLGAKKSRAQDVGANNEEESMSNRILQDTARPELPGSSGNNCIPPTDSPEYRRLQAKFGTKEFLGLLK